MLTISRSISKGKQLSEFKKGPVDILKHQCLNMCQISGIIGRSRCVCRNYIENAEKYGPRKSKLSPRTKKLICREASNKMNSQTKIKKIFMLNVTTQTVRNVLRKSDHVNTKE